MKNLKTFLLLVLLALPFIKGGVGPHVPIVEGDFVALHRAVVAVAGEDHFPLNQGPYGTCVAFGHAGGVDIVNAIDKLNGRIRVWEPASPDPLYAGSRCEAYGKESRSYGQGSNGYGATRWLKEKGGVLYQKDYPEFSINLTNYEIPRCRDWGFYGSGGKKDGIGGPFDVEAKKNPIGDVALVQTLDELKAALRNGYPVTICSGQGFTSVRDKDGFAKASGRWPHCMLVIGYRLDGREGFLILNSWGKTWISGPKYKDQPDGSFYCEPAVMARILSAGDSWALAGKGGFKKQKLPAYVTAADALVPVSKETYVCGLDCECEPECNCVEPDTCRKARAGSYEFAYQLYSEFKFPMLVMTGADWCGPCKTMKNNVIPNLNLEGVSYCHVDVDQEPELAQTISNSTSVPVLTLYYYDKDGKQAVKRLVGAHSVRSVQEFINGAVLQPVR
jgi:thiol-disulfide isomerase/thioredoxin